MRKALIIINYDAFAMYDISKMQLKVKFKKKLST